MIVDDFRAIRTINNAPNTNILKIFFYLAFNQPEDGICGYQIEKSQLQYDLNLGKTVFITSLSWLKENFIVNELKTPFYSDFMVNPYIVMNNGDRDARIKEWSRRIDLYNKNIIKNRERRRREQLKKQNS